MALVAHLLNPNRLRLDSRRPQSGMPGHCGAEPDAQGKPPTRARRGTGQGRAGYPRRTRVRYGFRSQPSHEIRSAQSGNIKLITMTKSSSLVQALRRQEATKNRPSRVENEGPSATLSDYVYALAEATENLRASNPAVQGRPSWWTWPWSARRGSGIKSD